MRQFQQAAQEPELDEPELGMPSVLRLADPQDLQHMLLLKRAGYDSMV